MKDFKNILAIDTATEYLSLALNTNGTKTYLLEKVGNKQSNCLINGINKLLGQANLTITDVNAILYNQGPGSFTGLRIGLSVAMGIALGLDIKLFPVSSFFIFAKQFGGKVIVILDARLNQAYLAGVDTSTWTYFLDPQVTNLSEIPILENCTYVGYGMNQYSDQLNDDLKKLLQEAKYPNAINLLDCINVDCISGVPPRDADLLYLRNKVALNLEEQKRHKLQNAN